MRHVTTVTDDLFVRKEGMFIELSNKQAGRRVVFRDSDVPYLLEYLYSEESGIPKDYLKRARI